MQVNKAVKKVYIESVNTAGQTMRTGARAGTAHEEEILGLANFTLNSQIALNILCCTGAKTFEEYKAELAKLNNELLLESFFNEAAAIKKKGSQ